MIVLIPDHCLSIFTFKDFHIAEDDPRVLEQFTGMKNGRLIGEIMKSENNVQTAGDCARLCLKLPTFSCLSINYDYGTSGLCELLKSIEGHDFIVAQVSYIHYSLNPVVMF